MTILLAFNPIRAYSGAVSPTGKIRYKVIYQPNSIIDPNNTSIIVINRPTA